MIRRVSIMDKEKSLKRNYAYNLSYQLLAILVPLVTTPYVTRVLGPEKLGDYAYTSAMVSYFGIVAALGTVTYAQREVACYQKAREERSRTFYEILFLRLFMVGIVFAAYCVFLFLAGTYRVLYIIQLCTVLSWAFDISWFFEYSNLYSIGSDNVRGNDQYNAGRILCTDTEDYKS